MSIGLYMDVHVPLPITHELRQRGVDVVTAQEDGTDQFADPLLLDRVTRVQRLLFTFDKDFLVLATQRNRQGISFPGIVYARPKIVWVSTCIADLELIAQTGELHEFADRVVYLPL